MTRVAWSPRPAPLSPEAVLIPFSSVHGRISELAKRALRGVASTQGLILLGREHELPWLPGSAYFSRSLRAPEVYFPTGLQPNLPEELVARATVQEYSKRKLSAGPYLISPEGWTAQSMLVSLSMTGTVDEQALTTFLTTHT